MAGILKGTHSGRKPYGGDALETSIPVAVFVGIVDNVDQLVLTQGKAPWWFVDNLW
jgi:hypothetical protein